MSHLLENSERWFEIVGELQAALRDSEARANRMHRRAQLAEGEAIRLKRTEINEMRARGSLWTGRAKHESNPHTKVPGSAIEEDREAFYITWMQPPYSAWLQSWVTWTPPLTLDALSRSKGWRPASWFRSWTVK